MNNSFINTKSSGFTLIELLVVVAIIGILAAIGIVSYSGYVEGTKKKSAENVLQQISLGQTEYYSDNGSYYTTHTGANCSGNATSSSSIETNLLGEADVIRADNDYNFCIATGASGDKYKVFATDGSCTLSMTGNGVLARSSC